VSGLWKGIVIVVLWRSGALRRARAHCEQQDPSRRVLTGAAWAQPLVAVLLVLAGLASFGLVALFIFDPNTQLLGVCGGMALALLASALVLAGRSLVPQETSVEHRPRPAGDREEAERAIEQAHAGAEGITRRRLLIGAAGAASAGLTAAVAIPVVALGPGIEGQLSQTPWRSGRALVDEQGKPILATAVTEGSFLTAFPQGADQENLGSPVVLVRVDPATLKLPAGRAGWAPEGILAYSKICTHAACAISLYRSPLSPSTQARGPALVCPCHYSTFNVLDGASVEFGPAGRPLPQLPITIDNAGVLRADGPMSGPIGPSWLGDRQ
jgi:ubiquinol-cytochrome c reductase iron-sulfur subunit